MSKTKTVQTAYGETSIEVVECDSCGNEISKEDARVFVTGDRMNSHVNTIKVRGNTKQGYICDYCDGAGPMDVPGSDTLTQILETLKPLWYDYDLDGIHPFKALAWGGLLIFAGIFILEVIAVLA